MSDIGWTDMKGGAVVGPVPRAIDAGMQVLAEGGNAVDAAVAAGLVSAVVRPDQNGIAGYGGAIVIHMADEGRTHAIDFDTEAPAAAHETMFELADEPALLYKRIPKGRVNERGYLSMSVPGTVAGWAMAAERFGTMSLSDLTQPALEACRVGFDIDEYLANHLRNHAEIFSRFPGTRDMFYPGGEPASQGMFIPNPETAEILKAIADGGVDAFYRGDVARHIADDVAKNGGILTYDDMAAYEPRTPEPIEVQIGEFTLKTVPPPAGGISPIQALLVSAALRKRIDLEPNSPLDVRASAEILRLVWWDRFDHIGDPRFHDFPYQRLVDQRYADELAYRVCHVLKEGPQPDGPGSAAGQGGTVRIATADGDGNLVSLTQTHGLGMGSGVVIPGTGLVMSGGMFLFDPNPGMANSIGPRKRPLHNMCPTIVLKNGKPFVAIGAEGGRKIIGTVYQALQHIVLNGLDVRDALLAPRIHFEARGSLFAQYMSRDAWDYLAKLGFDVREGSAAPSAVQLDLERNRLLAV